METTDSINGLSVLEFLEDLEEHLKKWSPDDRHILQLPQTGNLPCVDSFVC